MWIIVPKVKGKSSLTSLGSLLSTYISVAQTLAQQFNSASQPLAWIKCTKT